MRGLNFKKADTSNKEKGIPFVFSRFKMKRSDAIPAQRLLLCLQRLMESGMRAAQYSE